jgi:lysophospholipase L1-like esterase
MSKTIQNLLSTILFVFSIFIALLIGEGFLRLKNSDMKNYDIEMWKYAKKLKKSSLNPKLGHEHVENSTAILQSVEISINNFGLRGDQINKDVNRNRILFLGSSITLGWGVDHQDTMTERLNKMLNIQSNSYEVLNAGIGNYNTVRYVEHYLSKLSVLKPDSIVIQYFINDAESLKSGGGNWLLRNSQLAVTLMIAFNRVLYSGDESSLINHYRDVYSKNSGGFDEMQRSIEALAEHAQKNNIKLFFVMTPDFHNLIDYPFLFIHSKMKDISIKNDIPFLDLLPYFEGIPKEEIWAMPGDPHPNQIGHEIMASAIKDNFNF